MASILWLPKMMLRSENPRIKDSVELYWPLDGKFYSSTVVALREENGMVGINYEDGDSEKLELSFLSLNNSSSGDSKLDLNHYGHGSEPF